MTGQFSEKDPRRCEHYARFFKHLTLWEANLIFWGLFACVLILMCIASLQHHKSIALPAATTKHEKVTVRRHRIKLLSVVSLCLFLSLACAVLECFAAFNIEYCDGEDLMQLYWGFWSILQVGSIVAILGVMLQFWIALGDVETPSWAVALGTPVLVFAALGFVIRIVWRRTWMRWRGLDHADKKGEADKEADLELGSGVMAGRSMSQAPTIVPNVQPKQTEEEEPVPERALQFERPELQHARSNFWNRDLHYLLSHVFSESEPGSPESTD